MCIYIFILQKKNNNNKVKTVNLGNSNNLCSSFILFFVLFINIFIFDNLCNFTVRGSSLGKKNTESITSMQSLQIYI